MSWVLRSPQIHSTFSNLGYSHSDGYHVNENCNDALEQILQNILNEDKNQRNYRRSISFGQSFKKDLIPLLIHATDDNTIELLIKILVNLTIPVECLLSIEITARTDTGRHTIFEINGLLASIKSAITDHRVTNVIIEYLLKNMGDQPNAKLSTEKRTSICNTLLLLRNILHIPEELNFISSNHNGPPHMIQNKILANLFSQHIDKVLLRLIAMPDAIHWAVTMVQLIALLYKDQHVLTLHKLLNIWLETTLSESSEDNESNTSPQNRGSDQSPVLSSEADTSGSGRSDEDANANVWEKTSTKDKQKGDTTLEAQTENEKKNEDNSEKNENSKPSSENSEVSIEQITKEIFPNENLKRQGGSENSDGNYPAPMAVEEATTTSSNEDEVPVKKARKLHNVIHKINNKPNATIQERKRKRIVKRAKLNIAKFDRLIHSAPTDDDVSNILKEFTVDFLLKGYNALVKTLHTQILTNEQLDIDTSHFFWLITYFLKFANQMELDLEHVCNVLSFDILSYLTAESVNLSEQFHLMIKLDGTELTSCRRRLHLAVTAIREFVQAIEVYNKAAHVKDGDKAALLKLQLQMCETDELRSLLVLLLRHYNPSYHSKQYLQDVIVTNHILLSCIDDVMRSPDYKGTGTMVDHVRQFGTLEIMYQYGLLLENYEGNGEFVNDCVFTIMHHVAGELGCLFTLFQPKILRTFTTIWKTEFEICDDWSDLIQYTINTFIRKPQKLQLIAKNLDQGKKHKNVSVASEDLDNVLESKATSRANSKDGWAEHEISSLSWYYMQCKAKPNVIGEIVNLFKEDGVYKTSDTVIKELLNQAIINKDEYEKLVTNVAESSLNVVKETKKLRENEIGKLCEQLSQDGKSKFLDWVQSVLLETCHAKIYLQKYPLDGLGEATDAAADSSLTGSNSIDSNSTDSNSTDSNPIDSNPTNSNPNDPNPIDSNPTKKCDRNNEPVVSPVSYHAVIANQSVPLVPWNCQQAAICKDLKFLQLLHKLGFYMPVDTGKVFIRIPNYWTADFMYEVAGIVAPIDPKKLKFSLSDISESSIQNSKKAHSSSSERPDSASAASSSSKNQYQVHKEKRHTKILNFTPLPGTSFNSTGGYDSQPSWLAMIHKSQDYNISLEFGKSIITSKTCLKTSITEENTGSVRSRSRSLSPLRPYAARPSTPQSQPIAEQDLPNQLDFDCNNSVCDTASVASDLTRMYVSDEDEDESQYMPCPVSPLVPSDDDHSDMECIIATKRPRVQFMAPF